MSCDDARCPGFWKSVNNASSNRTMMTQRAKLRRLAFIDLPSWSRGSRPYVLGSKPLAVKGFGSQARIPDPLPTNLGGARANAKGTCQDYLAHPSPIPGQIMAAES